MCSCVMFFFILLSFCLSFKFPSALPCGMQQVPVSENLRTFSKDSTTLVSRQGRYNVQLNKESQAHLLLGRHTFLCSLPSQFVPEKKKRKKTIKGQMRGTTIGTFRICLSLFRFSLVGCQNAHVHNKTLPNSQDCSSFATTKFASRPWLFLEEEETFGSRITKLGSNVKGQIPNISSVFSCLNTCQLFPLLFDLGNLS